MVKQRTTHKLGTYLLRYSTLSSSLLSLKKSQVVTFLKRKMSQLQDENAELKRTLEQLRNENCYLKAMGTSKSKKMERDSGKVWIEKDQVYKVMKTEIVPKCPYIGNKHHHMQVMLEICNKMGISDKIKRKEFMYKYELDILKHLSQYRNNCSQQLKKKLDCKYSYSHYLLLYTYLTINI